MSDLFRARVRQAIWSCVAGQRSRARDLARTYLGAAAHGRRALALLNVPSRAPPCTPQLVSRSCSADSGALRAPGNLGNTLQSWADVGSRLIEDNKPALKNRWRRSWRTLPVCHAMQASPPSLRCDGRVPRLQKRGEVTIEGRLDIGGRLLPCELGAALPTAFLRIGDQAHLATASNRDRLGSRVELWGEES